MPREEIAPGVFVGSEISDIDKETKELIRRLVEDNDVTVMKRINELSDRRQELLLPPRLRKKR